MISDRGIDYQTLYDAVYEHARLLGMNDEEAKALVQRKLEENKDRLAEANITPTLKPQPAPTEVLEKPSLVEELGAGLKSGVESPITAGARLGGALFARGLEGTGRFVNMLHAAAPLTFLTTPVNTARTLGALAGWTRLPPGEKLPEGVDSMEVPGQEPITKENPKGIGTVYRKKRQPIFPKKKA